MSVVSAVRGTAPGLNESHAKRIVRHGATDGIIHIGNRFSNAAGTRYWFIHFCNDLSSSEVYDLDDMWTIIVDEQVNCLECIVIAGDIARNIDES